MNLAQGIQRFTLCLCLCAFSPFDTVAQQSLELTNGGGPEVVTDNMRTQLVTEYISVTPGQTFTVAMRQQIRPHWHTYWKNPGDSGEPTELTWQLPGDWEASEILWPAPERIPYDPLVNFGYSDEVLLLTEITVPETNQPGSQVTLQADAFWLVCDDVCIPEEGALSLTLNIADTPQPSAWKSSLDNAKAELPRALPWSAQFTLNNNKLAISFPLPEQAQIKEAVYFPYQGGVIENAAEQAFTTDENKFVLEVPAAFAAQDSGKNGILVLTETTSGTEVKRAYTLEFGEPAPSFNAGLDVSWWAALLMALAGGVILNLMPCVFPVLSIKALSLVQLTRHQAQHQKREATTHGIYYSTGVILGFLLLAAVLLLVRASGSVAGWGFHLQNPYVVLALIWLFFTIGLNLSGVFEIGGRLMNLGQGLTQGNGHKQSFFTGLLATVVATPCTAPFMGVALGYALVQPAIVTMLVFFALGVGMALPFMLLCAFPAWLKLLPKPGAWMQNLKEFLAFPMYASAIWLLWVLTQQTSATGTFIATVGTLAIALTIWLGKLPSKVWRYGGQLTVIALLLIFVNRADISSLDATEAGSVDDGWTSYSEENLQHARSQGPVFVNFTADWCITCKANEKVALSSEKVINLFDEKGVQRIKADWTRRDDVIARAIARYGRSGVPLYLWYSSSEVEQPEILPQLLSETLLIEKLNKLESSKLAAR